MTSWRCALGWGAFAGALAAGALLALAILGGLWFVVLAAMTEAWGAAGSFLGGLALLIVLSVAVIATMVARETGRPW